MGWIITIILGGIVGWLASYTMSPERRNYLLNIIVGIVGGLLGIWFFFGVLGLVGGSLATNFWLGILWTIVGAVVFIVIVDTLAYAQVKMDERRSYRGGVAHEYYEKDEYKKKRRDR